MSLRNRNPNMGGRMERTIMRAVLVIGLAAACGLWYLGRGVGEGASLFLPGLAGLAVVGGVNWFGRVRARERWEAAWDHYAAHEHEDDRLEPVEEDADAGLYLVGSR
jgi:hypothetical protein